MQELVVKKLKKTQRAQTAYPVSFQVDDIAEYVSVNTFNIVNLSPTKINIIYFHNQDAPPQSSPMMQVYHVINTAKALDTWQDKLRLIRTGVDAGNMKVPARAIL